MCIYIYAHIRGTQPPTDPGKILENIIQMVVAKRFCRSLFMAPAGEEDRDEV